WSGRQILSGLGVPRRRDATVVEHAIFVRPKSRLAPDSRKEGRQSVVISLAPHFKRMVMAARALDSQAEEQLSHVLDLLLARLDFAIPCDRWMPSYLA